jgi:FkbM family methyltransferase
MGGFAMSFADYLKRRMRSLIIPPTRAYLRYAPVSFGKRALWNHLVGPRLAWAPHVFEARTTFGSHVRGNTIDHIQRYLYYFGVWEPHITRWISATLAEGDAFIDVGANLGYYSLLAATRVGPRGHVVAIEASPTIFANLGANLAKNHADRVRALNVAVSDQSGRVRVFQGSADNTGTTTIVADTAARGTDFTVECEVDAAPLGALLTEEEIRRTRIIKIDVEGAELAVARGLVGLLARLPPAAEIIVEVGPDRLNTKDASAVTIMDLFKEAGYFPYAVRNDYSAEDYLPPTRIEAPKRIRGPLLEQTDVVFSRRDADVLPLSRSDAS